MKISKSTELVHFLKGVDFLRGIDSKGYSRFAEQIELHTLEPEQFLFLKDDESDDFYLVIEGSLKVHLENEDKSDGITLTINPRGYVGEMASLMNAPRNSSVQGVEKCLLARLSGPLFLEFLDAYPNVQDRVRRKTLNRISILKSAALSILGDSDSQIIEEIQSEMEWIYLQGGQTLFRQGDPGDALYLICSGRVQVIFDDGQSAQTMARLGRGDLVGEMAILSGEARSATARATRDTQLVRISDQGFSRLIQKNPKAARHIMKTLVERNRQINQHPRMDWLGTLAVVPLSAESVKPSRQLMEAVNRSGDYLILDSDIFHQRLGLSPKELSWDLGSPGATRFLEWLSYQETRHEIVLYLCDREPTEWTEFCIRQADKVLLVISDKTEPTLTELEHTLLEKNLLVPTRKQEFVILHDSTVVEPKNTDSWLASRRVSDFHHLKTNSPDDFVRLARILTGKATGLVLSGGGARGFAHIGILRALVESGISIDYIGGTSIGSVVGAFYAMGMDLDELTKVVYEEFVTRHPTSSYNLPFVSLISGNRIDSGLQRWFGKYKIEDLWLKFFCVSCNLTEARPEIHQNGSLFEAVRASIALPGILPPHFKNGSVLVDGGVLNNLPVDVMKNLWGGFVIASDVGSQDDVRVPSDLDTCPSPYQILRRRWSTNSRAEKLPSIGSILLNSMLCSSQQQRKQAIQQANFLLNPPLDEFSLLGFDKMHEIIEIGYRYTVKQLPRIRETIKISASESEGI